MRKQTQSSQYGYVSPKCKSIRLDAGFCQVGSYGEAGKAGGQGSFINDTGEDY